MKLINKTFKLEYRILYLSNYSQKGQEFHIRWESKTKTKTCREYLEIIGYKSEQN